MVQLIRHDNILLGGGEIDIETLPPSPTGWTDAARNVGFGLVIDSDLLNGSSSPCDTFGNPSLIQHSQDGCFEITNLEIWTMTACEALEDAEKMELFSLFVQKNMQS